MEQSSGGRLAPALMAAALLAGGLVIVAATPAAAADILRVPSEHPSIAEALMLAVDGDTIEVAPGTYAENLDFAGKDVHLVSSGGPGVTTIDGVSGSVVTIGPGGSVEGFTITGGTAPVGSA